MNKNGRILFGITTKSHSEIALDEMYGLQEMGYTCDQFEFGGRKKFKSLTARFVVILFNAFKLLVKSYRFKPDIIYLNSRVEYMGSTRDFITILVFKIFYFKKNQFIIKSHGSNLEVLQSRKFLYKNIIFPFLKRYVRAWLFLSTEELFCIKSKNLLENHKLFLTKNIVRVDKFKIDKNFRNKLNISADTKILLFVGRIIKEKGLAYIVEAFAEIRKKNKVLLIIVGDGEELACIRNKIMYLNISKEVFVTGWVDETEASYYTSNSDVLIYPTFAPEGLPMSLFNGLAAGLSIITTQIRAANDYLTEPDNCLWVEPKSSSSIVSALEKLLNNNDLMDLMRVNNKIKSKLFTKDLVAENLDTVLNSINSNTHIKIIR
jgi:glycosyltransferase involved in cell wall biosynthesis